MSVDLHKMPPLLLVNKGLAAIASPFFIGQNVKLSPKTYPMKKDLPKPKVWQYFFRSMKNGKSEKTRENILHSVLCWEKTKTHKFSNRFFSIAKEKLRQFELAQYRGEANLLTSFFK